VGISDVEMPLVSRPYSDVFDTGMLRISDALPQSSYLVNVTVVYAILIGSIWTVFVNTEKSATPLVK